MATRFYLPASGTAPLGSLAVDSGWTRSDNLDRRPCDTTKGDTSLTQKSAVWQTTSSASWVWVQFQSKRLAAGYSWTTADTVSMVIKVAESAAQVDSHLSYCIRVVSGDGSTIRGTIGVYRTTSSEYPTSLANIATRIHDARTDGASNFSSSAGDRIIIEIGHWGVTPSAATTYHNYGDPSATSDYALTAGLTTDLCPWVELSRDVSFDVTSSKPAYLRGAIATSANTPAYLNGSNPSYPASAQHAAYTKGKADATPSQKPAYLRGSAVATPSNKPAYLRGSITPSPSSKPAYMRGIATTLSNKSAYTRGSVVATPSSKPAYLRGGTGVSSNKPAYMKGAADTQNSTYAFLQGWDTDISDAPAFIMAWDTDVTSAPAFTVGGITVSGSNPAYLEGFQLGGDVSASTIAFLIGIDNLLVPDGDLSSAGTWMNETEGISAIYQSINETSANDSNYIWDIDPATNDYYECSLTNPIGTPGSGDVVVLWRGRDKSGLNTQCTVQIRQGAVVIASTTITLSAYQRTFYLQLTPAERAEITDWNDLRIRIIPVIG